MPTGNLPEEGKKLYEEVYRRYLNGECKGDEECASKRAWGAVKQAGWKKDAGGEWHKSKSNAYAELSLHIEKATFDSSTQERRWSAIASDIDYDSHAERMSLELYQDFIERAKRNERPPERFCSEYWSGGMPYLSLSHYSDQNGGAVPGIAQKMYIDGRRFRAKGKFLDNKIGLASFDSIRKDKDSDRPDKVRISIGFLDYAHYHGQYLFERKSLRDECPLCAMGIGDITYAKGLLLHLALTRCPVNTRTDIRPDDEGLEVLSMTTRKEDAASIVGEEIAEELDKSEVVIRSETQEPEPALVERADEETVLEEADETHEESAEPEVDARSLEARFDEMNQKLDTVLSSLSAKSEVQVVTPHVLDAVLEVFRSDFDSVSALSETAESKLQRLQPAFEALANEIRSLISAGDPKPEPIEQSEFAVSRSEFNEALLAINEKLSLISTQLTERPAVQAEKSVAMPQRMSVSPAQLLQKKATTEQPSNTFAQIARKSVGLPI